MEYGQKALWFLLLVSTTPKIHSGYGQFLFTIYNWNCCLLLLQLFISLCGFCWAVGCCCSVIWWKSALDLLIYQNNNYNNPMFGGFDVGIAHKIYNNIARSDNNLLLCVHNARYFSCFNHLFCSMAFTAKSSLCFLWWATFDAQKSTK